MSKDKETAVVTFDLAPESTDDGAFVIRHAPVVFRTGNYADKGFSLSAEEAKAAVAEFQGVPIGLEHVPTVLSGQLGEFKSLGHNDPVLFGDAKLPKWLDEVLPKDKRKLSATFDRQTKRLKSVDLVLNPRIPDAHLLAAFSADSIARGGIDATAIFSAVKQAVAEVMSQQPTPPPPPPPPSPEPKPSPAPTGPTADFKDQEIERLKQQMKSLTDAKIASEAVAFADSEIHAKRAFPAERDGMIRLYIQAANADVTFAADNKPATMVADLRKAYAARPAHKLDVEFMGNGQGTRILNSDHGSREDIDKAAERAKQAAKRENERLAASKA